MSLRTGKKAADLSVRPTLRTTPRRGAFALQQPKEARMKGTPRSFMLSWANAVAGWWTSAAVSAVQRQQRAALKAMMPKARKPRRARRPRKS
jgi:hypothetical protein